MVFIKCDKCTKDMDNTSEVHNIILARRDVGFQSTDVAVIYDKSLHGSVKENLIFHICKDCYTELHNELTHLL